MTMTVRDELGRLAALDSFDILDTPRERDFDEVAELAAEICGTPIAVVNLIAEHRQFFKAEVGLGVRETPLESSFCAKAILEEEFLEVPDATQDPRFDCNPLVTSDPGLRFYAGAILRTSGGHAIGTVCVLDMQPRHLTDLQRKTLRVFARQVVKQLELRRALRLMAEADRQRALLNQELFHRLKNTLAIVQVIASQTLRNVTERDAVSALEQRLHSLGRAHEVLIQENWTEAPIHQVVKLALSLHDDLGRIHVAGPDLTLGAKATLGLSLLLHELGTNASKYGSLSTETGSVSLTWTLEEAGGEPQFCMTWEETGGPTIATPVRSGFGSRLIRMGIVGAGGATSEFLPAGLRASFTAPIELLQSQ